jgi:hypothetical protein
VVSLVGVVTLVTSAITGAVPFESSLLLLQEMIVRLIRNMEKMMSICLTWFPISGLGKPKLYQNMWCFTRMWDFTWRLSNCEELVGVTYRRMMGLVLESYSIDVTPDRLNDVPEVLEVHVVPSGEVSMVPD